MNAHSRRALVSLAIVWLSAALLAGGQATSAGPERIVITRGGPLAGRNVLLVGGGKTFAERTDARGAVQRPPVPRGTVLEALYLLDERPSSRPGHDGWASRTYARGAVQGVAATLVFTLTTFNVVVSLEWQPGSKEQELAALPGCPATPTRSASYLDDLQTALRDASAYLYDLSDGQMAYEKVTIHTGAEAWDGADIRVLANDDYRPTAFVGGDVDAPTPFTTANGHNLVFQPGMIYLSRLWDSHNARCGPWSELAGARTIGHEWSHYALRLWDEYAQPDVGASTYCAGSDLPWLGDTNKPSAMAYHYTSSEFWLNEVAASCVGTEQDLVHGESDWKALKRMFPTAITLPSGSPLPGPSFEGSAAAALFSAGVASAPSALATTSALVRPDAPLPPAARPQAYSVRPALRADGTISTTYPIQRIIGQGALPPGEDTALWGVEPKDEVSVQGYDWTNGTRWTYPTDARVTTPLPTGGPTLLPLKESAWQPDLQIIPVVDGQGNVVGLRVLIRDCAKLAPARRLLVGYCPAGADCPSEGPAAPAFATLNGDTFEHTFFFTKPNVRGEPPARHGYIYARDALGGDQIVSWYQLGGGVGPGHADQHPPLADGSVAVNVASGTDPKRLADTRVLFSPALGCAPQRLPQGFVGVLGTPVSVQVAAGDRVWSPNDPPLLVRVAYDVELATRLGLATSDLALLALPPGGARWAELKTLGANTALGWLAAQPLPQGTVLAVAYRAPAPRVLLPLVLK